MITTTQGSIADLWRQRINPWRRHNLPRRPLAAMGFLADGLVAENLIDIERLIAVILFDELRADGCCALRLSGLSAIRVPCGIRWGGAEGSKFFKDLLLEPRPQARGQRLDIARRQLIELGLELDRDLSRHAPYPDLVRQRQLRLPRLWAGFRTKDGAEITGQGVELEIWMRRMGMSAQQMMDQRRRTYFDLTLFPLPWVSHCWEKIHMVFADLDGFPQRQIFPLTDLPGDLQGVRGAVEFDFFGNRFRKIVEPVCPDGSQGVVETTAA